jgi:predicted nucleic-acid-binding protein
MIGLDTNVMVRFLVHDDPRQTASAVELMGSLTPAIPGFLSLVVIVELVWVLQDSYRLRKEEIIEVLDSLLRSKELHVERADIVWQALKKFTTSRTDFSDCLIERCGHGAGCQHTITFDRQAAKAAGMKLLE